MKYHYLRIFAVSDERFPLLAATILAPVRLSRSDYLQSIFGERIDFLHRKAKLVYLPIGADDERDGGPVLLGRVGRSVTELVNEPPEQGFAEVELESWRAANFLLDTGGHQDGQKVAMQVRGDVGQPFAVVSSLIAHLNNVNPDSGWILELSPISEPGNFWTIAREYKGEITSAVFSFVAPNILGLRSGLNEGLKDAKDKNNAHRVSVTLSNENGNLDLEAKNIKDAVEYVSKGGGVAKLKRGNKVIYDSTKDEKTIDLDNDEPILSDRKSQWRDFIDRLFK